MKGQDNEKWSLVAAKTFIDERIPFYSIPFYVVAAIWSDLGHGIFW